MVGTALRRMPDPEAYRLLMAVFGAPSILTSLLAGNSRVDMSVTPTIRIGD